MATATPLGSDDEVPPKQELYLSFDEVITTVPVFLQPVDEQERNDLAMFLSQVDHLHKPVAGKLSARSVFNYLQYILKLATPTTEQGPLQVIFTEQMKELTENIAFEIASNVVNDVDIHTTTISVLKVLEEVSWETKTALTITTFVLTFGDKGFNICEESKVSANEIQMFAEHKGGYKQQLEGRNNLFTILSYLIGYIVEFENLPVTYRTSTDHKVKVERTQLIVIVYWIIKIIVAASSSHIIRISSMGNEFDKTILALRELSSRWFKNLKDLSDKEHLKTMLSKLQDLLKKDVDIELYNKIKAIIIEQRNHSDNMNVLNALFPSDVHPLYDCLRRKKVHHNNLKGAFALLFISGLEDITPEVSESMLNEFIDSFDVEGNNKVECNVVWISIVDEEHSLQRKEATEKSMVKPFLDLFYVVHQKLKPAIEDWYKKQKNFKGWYRVEDPSMISNEVKKLIRDDWKYKKGEPMIVALDPQGKVVNHNAIHMFYIWGIKAFPFTSEREENLWKNLFGNIEIYFPLYYGLRQLHEEQPGYIYYYGGENAEWIRSLTGMMREIERELGIRIYMLYVGRSHNEEQVRSVNEEKLSHCLTDQYLLWLFWQRLESILYSGTHAGRFHNSLAKERLQRVQRWLNYDKSNVGWVYDYWSDSLFLGKVALSTLKEFRLWKGNAKNEGFSRAFKSHYNKIDKKMFPFESLEYPTRALKAPIETMLCPECDNQMQEYTTFVCYHPQSRT